MPFEDLDVLETEHYSDKFEELEDEVQERIDSKIEMIREHPKRNSKTLQDSDHKGLRRYRIGDHRLIYLWCGEAMEKDGVGTVVKEIIEQDHIEEDHLVLMDVGDRDHIYEQYE